MVKFTKLAAAPLMLAACAAASLKEPTQALMEWSMKSAEAAYMPARSGL